MRVLVLAIGCSSGVTGTLALSWQFADGRRCPDTGAASMAVRVAEGAPASYLCGDGVVPQAVTLTAVPADGVTLEVQALSTEAAALYSGRLELNVLPASATVILYADKMR